MSFGAAEPLGSVPLALVSFDQLLEPLYGELEQAVLPETWVSGATIAQGCLPLLMEEGSAGALIERLGQKKYQHLRSLYRQSSVLNLWYTLALREVLGAIAAAAIPVMVLKGADLASSLYPRPALRHFGDVDLLVLPEHLDRTIALLEQLGYRYHQEYRFEAISRQRAAFVYVKEIAGGYLIFELHTAPHSNEMGVSFNPQQIWQRARSITVADVVVQGMGLEDLLLYLCWHYRSHAFNRLIWFYDIALLLQRYSEQLDWALVSTLARARGLRVTVGYCMRWCQQIFGLRILCNADEKNFAAPLLVRRLLIHLVKDDCSAVLTHTAYRERKLLQRLMVDSLTTLSLVMFRSIVPTPTHLGRLYAEDSHLPVHLIWLYYPAHPFLLVRTYLRARYHR